MREIEFRGKKSNNGEWVYGDLLRTIDYTYIFPIGHIETDGHHIRQEDDGPHWVIPETVGQYTGLKDKNGVKIFEMDILSWKQPILRNPKALMGVVKIMYADYIVEVGIEAPFMWSLSSVHGRGCEVIGNIHDNPELLEEQK